MESVCIFLLMLGWSAAIPQDMSGKMFTFPQESRRAHVNLTINQTITLDELTVCLRAFTDLSTSHNLFSLVIPSEKDGFHMTKDPTANSFTVRVREFTAVFRGLEFVKNKWHSLCSTWDSVSGLAQVWIDEKGSSRRYAEDGNLTGPFSIFIGKGEGDWRPISFVGMMTDLHMWDYILFPDQISLYSHRSNFPPGNVLNWTSLEFQIVGRILVEEEQMLFHN